VGFFSFFAWGIEVLGCVFYSLPTKVLSGGFAEGRMYERRERADFVDPGAK
jgi:hypothetical protein